MTKSPRDPATGTNDLHSEHIGMTALQELLNTYRTASRLALSQGDANTFTAVIYQEGQSRAQCRISLGSAFGRGINHSQDLTRSNSSNGMLNVEHDDQHLHMDSGLSMHGDRDEKLGLEGAAEHFWSMLMEPLQR